MTIPADLSYSSDHEWVRLDGDLAVVGITAHAQNALGDVVFVALPEVGRTVVAGEAVGEVESTKSVSDLFSPVAGRVSEVNEAAVATPEIVNTDPYGEGWLVKVTLAESPSGLLDAAGYAELIGQ